MTSGPAFFTGGGGLDIGFGGGGFDDFARSGGGTDERTSLERTIGAVACTGAGAGAGAGTDPAPRAKLHHQGTVCRSVGIVAEGARPGGGLSCACGDAARQVRLERRETCASIGRRSVLLHAHRLRHQHGRDRDDGLQGESGASACERCRAGGGRGSGRTTEAAAARAASSPDRYPYPLRTRAAPRPPRAAAAECSGRRRSRRTARSS